MSEPFMNRLVDGRAFLDDVDDYVDTWRTTDTVQSLAEFLGMSKEEYGLWVETPAALRFIAKARVQGLPLPLYEAVARAAAPAAAMRASDSSEANTVLAWLRETGRIKT